MDIANLHAFIVVATKGSFSLAAPSLHLTQPAVSKRVAALEDELETKLFDRIGRRVTLTEAGQTLLPRARRILNEVDDSRRALRNLSGQVSGPLSIGTSHHIGLHRLPPVLRMYTQRYPQVQLDIRFLDSEVIHDDVARGDLELGIGTLPITAAEGVQIHPVWVDELAFVSSPTHPLARRREITLDILASYPAILPGETTYTHRIIERAFALRGVQVRVSLSTNYLETIKMMVSVGLGWSVLPGTMLDTEIIALPIKELRMERTLGVIQNKRHTLSNAARAMLELLLHASIAPTQG